MKKSVLLSASAMALGLIASPAFADATAPCNDGLSPGSTECGTISSTTGNVATAVGFGALADAGGTALGYYAYADDNSTALGAQAVTAAEAVAIGAGSSAAYAAAAVGRACALAERGIANLGRLGRIPYCG